MIIIAILAIFRVWSNNSCKWRNMKINNHETFQDQCKQKRRPRINFKELRKHFDKDCKLIFEDTIENIFNYN